MRLSAVLFVVLVSSACASGGSFGRDSGGGHFADAPPALDGGVDPALDAALLDAPGLDAPGTDAPEPTTPDAPFPIVDAGSLPDVPGGPITCTAATAGTVCGGRPCVDGFCCDGPCTGACQACNLSGRQGVCSPEPMGTACDDGVACTHTDVCSAVGACGGSAITCTSTMCATRSCNGTSACAETLRTGMSCDDGNASTTGDVCAADGTCAGTTSSCTMPADACANGTQSRDRCINARIIGRTAASAGWSISASTCSASNRFDTSCWDAGGDHAYRIFLRAGESIAVTYAVDWACPTYTSSFWDGTLSIYEGTGCADYSCTTQALCERYVSSSFSTNYTAPRDGWVTLVADGSTAFDDEGDYTLSVRLTCGTMGCGC